MSVDFQYMDIELCDRCRCDYVTLHNGGDPQVYSTEIDTYCGFVLPHPVTSTLPTVFITFVTDKHGTYPGFKLKYHFSYLAGQAATKYNITLTI